MELALVLGGGFTLFGTMKWGFKFLRLLVLLSIMLVVVGALSHAVSKHGQDAITAKHCFDNYGNSAVVVKPDNENRRVELCLIPDPETGGFKGMAVRVSERIDGVYQELTRYVDWNIKTANAMLDYAETEAGTWGWINFLRTTLFGG